MNWALTVILLLGVVSLCQGVILSLEESELGAEDYRYFYLTLADVDNGFYAKPFFTLVNSELSRPYGALGSLYCGSSTFGIAVYSDVDTDDLNEWNCQSINLLPFAEQGGGVPSPPICPLGTVSGTPALFNLTANAWTCGPYNQVLTHATRETIDENCASADFLMYYEDFDEIRCVNPQDILPELTLQTRDANSLAERVDVNNDKKWHNIMSGIEVTTSTTRAWNFFKWTPSMNYDTTSTSSQVSTPPQALPFASTLIAATFASFKVSSYTYTILPPTSSDRFTGVVSKLTASLGETIISNSLEFTSISATGGQVTYGFSGLAAANCTAGESFVAGITNRSWTALPLASERHLVTITLWIQTSFSFTQIWPLP